MLKNYIDWFKNNQNTPIVRMLIMISVTIFVTLILNWVKGTSLTSNVDYIVCLIIMYSGALFMNRYIHYTWIQFTLSFFVVFIILTIQMFSDGSYVDYTSFIVTDGVALFMAFMMLLVTKYFSKLNRLKK